MRLRYLEVLCAFAFLSSSWCYGVTCDAAFIPEDEYQQTPFTTPNGVSVCRRA